MIVSSSMRWLLFLSCMLFQIGCTTTTVSEVKSSNELIKIKSEKQDALVRVTTKSGEVIIGNLWDYTPENLLIKTKDGAGKTIKKIDVAKYEQTTDSALSKVTGDVLAIPLGVIWILTGMPDQR